MGEREKKRKQTRDLQLSRIDPLLWNQSERKVCGQGENNEQEAQEGHQASHGKMQGDSASTP